MYIYSSGCLVIQSCLTLVTPWIVCSPPHSSVHGLFQARILEWVAIPFSRYTYLKIYIYIYIYTHTHTPEDICSWRRECIWSHGVAKSWAQLNTIDTYHITLSIHLPMDTWLSPYLGYEHGGAYIFF